MFINFFFFFNPFIVRSCTSDAGPSKMGTELKGLVHFNLKSLVLHFWQAPFVLLKTTSRVDQLSQE